MQLNQSLPLDRALCSLEGLSVGDAFGERFFVHPTIVAGLLAKRILPIPPWRFTDDTEMALSIVETLQDYGAIRQDELARRFAERYDPSRGYGVGMHGMLARVRTGESWRIVSQSQFEGQGSFGNGAAMRAAPIGGYFADDLAAVVEQAHRSAEVTHAHPEGIAGAIAVAVAAAWAWRVRDSRATISPPDFLDRLLPHIPESTVRGKIVRARDLRPGVAVEHVAAMLGSGDHISAQDTVPFALWCAAHHLDNYEEALWVTVSGLGDRDTTCAMVGGIVSLATGLEGIPQEWRAHREPLGRPRNESEH
jgi:ADP-ribosylglycohydrolase